MWSKMFLLAIVVMCSSFSMENERDRVNIDYISTHRHLALQEAALSGIPASVIMAQAIVETGGGQSILARRANNHFGIKCKSTWEGATYFYPDDDRDAQGKMIDSCFRIYDSVEESYRDHSRFLMERERYSRLFSIPTSDYEGWCQGIRECGYATDIKYSHKLIDVIERYNLDNLN